MWNRRWQLAMAMAAPFVGASGIAAQTIPVRELVQELRIDGAANELTSVGSIHATASGNIILTTPGDYFAKLFSPTGKFVKNFARKGAGPGEVRELETAGLVGDTLWMYDYALNRIALFGSDGSAGRMFQLKPDASWQRGRTDSGAFHGLNPLEFLPGNMAIGTPVTPADAITRGTVKTIPLVQMKWDGSNARLILDIPRVNSALEIDNGSMRHFAGQPFMSSEIYAISADGRRIGIVTLDPQRPIVRLQQMTRTTGDRWSPGPTAMVTLPAEPIPSRTVDSAIAAIATRTRWPGVEGQVRSKVIVPDFFPVALRVLIANDGTAWLRVRAPVGIARWVVISPSGTATAQIDLPRTVRIMSVDRGIWATATDSDDVPSVVRYRVK